MKKTTIALVAAALMAVAASPAMAHCGGAHAKAYRAAQPAKKPDVAKTVEPKTDQAPTTGTSSPTFTPGSAQIEGTQGQA